MQVTGRRRRVALPLAGKSTMDIRVHDHLAESRLFLSATAAENIDRRDYNAVEEARAVVHLVREAGSTRRRPTSWAARRHGSLNA